MRTEIVGPDAWIPVCRDEERRLPASTHALLGSILDFFHDRHVGMAPRVAADLALLLSPRGGAIPGRSVWGAMIERLNGGLPGSNPASAGGGAGRRLGAIVPTAVPAQIVSTVAFPLVMRAIERTGENVLFAGPGHVAPARFQEEYDHVQARQVAALREVLSADPMGALFWAERALVLAALSRRAAAGLPAGTAESLDLRTLALVLRLQPALERPAGARPAEPRFARSSAQRSGIRPRQEGVVGIRMSRRLDELDGILQSEFFNDDSVLLDRVVNTGFLVRHRPPPRQRRRDVLVVGLMPEPAGTAAALAKACWLDCMARLAVTLLRQGLPRSDLIWVEGDAWRGVRPSRVTIEALPGLHAATAWDLSAEERGRFLAAAGWIPSFLSARPVAPGGEDAPGPAGRDDDPATRHLDWMAGALLVGLQTRPEIRPLAADPADAMAVGEDGHGLEAFGVVHVMAFLPASAAPPTDSETRSTLFGITDRLGLAADGRSASLTWVPADIGARQSWMLGAGGRPPLPLAAKGEDGGNDGDGPDLHHLAGAVIGPWLSLLHEVVLGD